MSVPGAVLRLAPPDSPCDHADEVDAEYRSSPGRSLRSIVLMPVGERTCRRDRRADEEFLGTGPRRLTHPDPEGVVIDDRALMEV